MKYYHFIFIPYIIYKLHHLLIKNSILKCSQRKEEADATNKLIKEQEAILSQIQKGQYRMIFK